jgi:hypothetical protein
VDVAKSSRFLSIISALQKEESLLEAQLGKVRDAMAALGGAVREYKARQGLRKARTVVRNARKMTAAQKRAVSLRMKKYWADRRKKANA